MLATAFALGCSSTDDDLGVDAAAPAPGDAIDAGTSARQDAGAGAADGGDAAGSMSDAAAIGDGGVADDSGAAGDASADATVPLICTSGVYWTDGNMGDPEMNPGGDCLGCHKNYVSSGAPVFTLAGTVYPTLHELTTCDGTPRAKVVVVDSNDKTFTLESNDAGNFACGAVPVDEFPACVGLVFPVSITLTLGDGAAGPTTTGQTAGNCNACHSPKGANGAPGRITISGT